MSIDAYPSRQPQHHGPFDPQTPQFKIVPAKNPAAESKNHPVGLRNDAEAQLYFRDIAAHPSSPGKKEIAPGLFYVAESPSR